VAALFVAGAFVPAWAMPGAMALDASRARAKGLNTFIETFLEAARGAAVILKPWPIGLVRRHGLTASV
jgi:hypothetical protein